MNLYNICFNFIYRTESERIWNKPYQKRNSYYHDIQEKNNDSKKDPDSDYFFEKNIKESQVFLSIFIQVYDFSKEIKSDSKGGLPSCENNKDQQQSLKEKIIDKKKVILLRRINNKDISNYYASFCKQVT